MDLQNFIYLLFATLWLSGLIWAGMIAFKNRRGNEIICSQKVSRPFEMAGPETFSKIY